MGKKQITWKVTGVKMALNFSTATQDIRRKWSNASKFLKGNDF